MNTTKPPEPVPTTPDSAWFSLVSIRNANQEDLPALEWEGEYSRYRRIYAEVFRRMQRGLAVMWLAEVPEAGVIGQVFIQFDMHDKSCANGKDRGYIHSFRVRPEYRDSGLGTLLMDVAERDMQSRGYCEVTLNVARENSGALRLYQRLGYSILKKIPGRWSYYDEHNVLHHEVEPSYRMFKKLGG